MADNEEGTEPTSRGNEWEVVQLTASAYAAAPGPKGDESIHQEKGSKIDDSEAETSEALFMSRHFAFPPSQHENLPIEPGKLENQKENKGGEDMLAEDHLEERGEFEQKEDDNWNIKGLDVPLELPGMDQVFEEKRSRFSVHGSEFEAAALHGYDSAGEQNIYGSVHDGTTVDESAEYEQSVNSGLVDASVDYIDPSSDGSQSVKLGKEDIDDGSELPCRAWWKRRMASLCAHAKETNAFWSVFIAAAVMGLVMLGQRWQQERWQVLQQRWQLSLSDEKPIRMMSPLSRFKDVMIGGNRRGSYISGAASAER